MPKPPLDTGDTTSTPSWVKVFGFITLALILLFVITLFMAGHGPGRHLPSGAPGSHIPPVGHEG